MRRLDPHKELSVTLFSCVEGGVVDDWRLLVLCGN